jgi:exo-beta-1,3-glucanase (GH17 family)
VKKPLPVIAYSPYRDGQAPDGAEPSEAQVRADLEQLKPLINGIRVYSTHGPHAYIPKLCDELGIELHLGAWIDGLASDEEAVLELAEVVNAGHASLRTAIIGNEVLLRKALNGMTEERMIELVQLARSAIVNQNVQLAVADSYPEWMANRPQLAAVIDVLIWHTYPWWVGADIDDAYAFVQRDAENMRAMYPGKPMILGETGWPSQVSRPAWDSSSTAVGSEEHQARYYRELLTGDVAEQQPVWMFSAFDENWKSAEGAVGGHWGIFDAARQPKLTARELSGLVE